MTTDSRNDQQLHTQSTAQQADNPNQDSGNSPPRLTDPALSTSPKTTKSQQGAPAPPTPDTPLVEIPAAQRPITPTTSKVAPPAASKPTKAAAAPAPAPKPNGEDKAVAPAKPRPHSDCTPAGFDLFAVPRS
jgi:hypothetical protein